MVAPIASHHVRTPHHPCRYREKRRGACDHGVAGAAQSSADSGADAATPAGAGETDGICARSTPAGAGGVSQQSRRAPPSADAGVSDELEHAVGLEKGDGPLTVFLRSAGEGAGTRIQAGAFLVV